MTSRREMLTYAIPAMALAAVSARASAAAPQTLHSKIIRREQFDRYIALYNAEDPAFAQFYNSNVVMETVPPLTSASAVVEFRRTLSYYVAEHITVEKYVADETGSAAQFLGEFRCVRDMPITALSGLFGRALKKGQVMRQRGVILYDVTNGKFDRISAGPPIILQDWS